MVTDFATDSGSGSAIGHWSIDQRLWVHIPPMAKINFWHEIALWVYSAHLIQERAAHMLNMAKCNVISFIWLFAIELRMTFTLTFTMGQSFHLKICTVYWWPGSTTELGLKIRVYVLHWSAVATGAWVEKWYPMLLHTIVHSQASHMPTSSAPHTCDYIGYVHHVEHAMSSSKNHSDYLG